ncbi:MAG: phospholipase A [Gammaproteobacteria bacterium]|nr:phospholipase A [Gammaproteobacteria bacterium]
MLNSRLFLSFRDKQTAIAGSLKLPQTLPTVLILAAAAGIFSIPLARAAQPGAMDSCLLNLLHQPQNNNLTALEIKQACQAQLLDIQPAALTVSEADPGSLQQPNRVRPELARFNAFFEPYKDTYFIAGRMNGDDGYQPFSGDTADIKFALGLKFRLFPDLPVFDSLAPLYFGYSQKSWWDIAESSGPFREHNYNPEVFWDYSKTSNRNGFNFVGQLVDQIGFEHQSNGLDGSESRSWDRLYLQRDFQVTDRFNLEVKAWKDVNSENFNKDITDYLGNLKLSASYQPNERLVVNFKAQQGWETSKLSYQLDFVYRLPEWVNSQFMLSYYEGYGEALISYNQKTSSLRAGLFFPISFNGN